MRKHFLLYVVVLLIFGVGIFSILEFGSRLQSSEVLASQKAPFMEAAIPTPQAQKPEAVPSNSSAGLLENFQLPLNILLVQVIVIIVTAKLVGVIFSKIGQPTVIGEMLAGILLGPSLLGALSPGVEMFIFPAASLDTLKLLSQIGVILFMFGVGVDLDLHSLHQQARAAILISHASIIIPFFLGTAFSLLIYQSLAASNISFGAFALFMGIAMSITAFPVLARIIEERGLSNSYLGNITIACAAVDDVTAWCILAIVVAIAKADQLAGALLTIFLSLAFIGVMFFLIKPAIGRIFLKIEMSGEVQNKGLIAGILAFALASALFTEMIGIHALFGAFLAGAVMPPQANLRKLIKERIQTFSSVFLLPLFFAFTGLRTQIGLMVDGQSWLICAGIILVAILGKLGGSVLAARWTGVNWYDSVAIGILMNTRGLMELIALNIGYDLGILSPQIFAMMVLMALATTFMTGPLISLLEVWKRRAAVSLQ